MANPLLKPAPMAHMITALVFTPRQILLEDWVGAAGLLLYFIMVFCMFMPRSWGEPKSWKLGLLSLVAAVGLYYSSSNDLLILAGMSGIMFIICMVNAIIEMFAPQNVVER